MDTSIKAFFVTAALTAAAGAYAQAPTQPTEPGDPSTASSPHQRESSGKESREAPPAAGSPEASPEASAASSPHQHSVASEKMSSSKLKMAMQEGAVPESFVKNAAIAGMTEVELGKLALSKSQDPKVRNFAEDMVKDHSKANEELASIAKSKGMTVPTSLDAKHKSMVQSLSSKTGAAFDSAYSEHMQASHSEAIALFQGASKSSDLDLAAFAKKTLPTLKEHKEMANALPATRTAEVDTDADRETPAPKSR